VGDGLSDPGEGPVLPPALEVHGYAVSAVPPDTRFIMSDAAQLLARRLEPTRLDRRRMEHIALAKIQDDWLSILGNKQLVFYGHGGNPDNARSQRVSPR
jgi:hypothetical protein